MFLDNLLRKRVADMNVSTTDVLDGMRAASKKD